MPELCGGLTPSAIEPSEGSCAGDCPLTPPDTRVLLLGDSVDRTITKHACHAVAGLQESQVSSWGLQVRTAGPVLLPCLPEAVWKLAGLFDKRVTG